MGIAEKNIERVRNGQTAQGFYVVGYDGSFYEYNNNRSVERVLGVMDSALKKFRASPPKQVEIPASMTSAAQPWSPPEGTSIARAYARIIPVPSDAAPQNRRVSRDHLWILRPEVQEIYDRGVGTATFNLPKTLTSRIVRFNLVDNIRGEPVFWESSDVQKAEFRVTPVPGNRREFTITGSFAMATKDGTRGLNGKIEGLIEIDSKSMTISSLGLIADCVAWGAGPYTPSPPIGKFPLKIAIVDVKDEVSKVVAPQGTNWGDVYLHGTL